MKGIYKMNCDCGRCGHIMGIFIAEDYEMNNLINSEIEVEFGEVLGKHSDVGGPIEKKDIELITFDPSAIDIFEKYDLYSGYNPFNYLDEEQLKQLEEMNK